MATTKPVSFILVGLLFSLSGFAQDGAAPEEISQRPSTPAAKPSPARAMTPAKNVNAVPAVTQAPAVVTSAPRARMMVRKPQWSIGIRYISWQDELKIREGDFLDKGLAQYTGQVIYVERDFFRGTWGFGYGGGFGVGTARRGDFEGSTSYAVNKADWSAAFVSGKIFRVVNQRTLLGVELPISFRGIEWPTSGSRYTVSAVNQPQPGLTADLKVRLNRSWDFTQAIGAIQGGTGALWRIGLNYIF